MHTAARRSAARGGKRTARYRSPYRPMVVPGVGRFRRPPWWQLLACALVLAGSATVLAWVFSGGLAGARHSETATP